MHRQLCSPGNKKGCKLRVVIALVIALAALWMSCCSTQSVVFYSGETHHFSTGAPIEGRSYAYQWNASDGYATESDDRIFNWTAPYVDVPRNVTIQVNVSDGVCWGKNELMFTVYPEPKGEISLEKSFDGDQNDVLPGAEINYTVKITNIGRISITSIPLLDYYPVEFLTPISSVPDWDNDDGSALSWNNLLDDPLGPGDSINVSISFRMIAATDQMIINFVLVEGAEDEKGYVLDPQEADNIIAGTTFECPRLGPSAACVGEEVPFSALQGLPSYAWLARDDQGNSVGGFNDSTKANVTWKPSSAGVFEISFNNMMCRKLITVKDCNCSIQINKNCDYQDPVYIGDTVTYIYNVTNTGDLPLSDVQVTDHFTLGPDCLPVYVNGDDGDSVLDSGESWMYEYRYTVPDPANYTRLRIMAAGSASAKTAALVRSMMEMQSRLQIKMDNLKLLAQHFDVKAAALEVNHRRLDGIDHVFYNYTNVVTGEKISNILDPQGKLNQTFYTDPFSQIILVAMYDASGKILCDELEDRRNGEYLREEYNVPSIGSRTSTVIDRKTGNTLILVLDAKGNVSSMEYSKTPGFEVHEEKIYLQNTATVMARSPDGRIISDLDFYSLEIFRPLPALALTKTASPDPVPAGGTLNYIISFRNTGTQDAHSVIIEEAYSQGLKFLAADPVPDVGTINKWTIGDLRRGESGEIKIRMLVAAAAVSGEQLINRANLTCKENTTIMAVINTTVAGSPIKITKTATPDIVGPKEALAYTIRYSNMGADVQSGVVIHDYLDENVHFISSWPTPTGQYGGHYWWDIGDLEAGKSGEILIQTIVAEKPEANSIYNRYKASSLQTKGENATLETRVIHSLWIRKTADKSTCNRDENITYNISFGNGNGYGQNAKDVTVTDILPDVELLSASPLPDSVNGNILGWSIGELNAGESRNITVVVHVPQRPEVRFNEDSSVSGEGFVHVSKSLSTSEPSSPLVNRANISGIYQGLSSDYVSKASSSATVTINGREGTRVSISEHGSGYYEEQSKSSLKLNSRSITTMKSIFAKTRNTSLSLPGNRIVSYESLWSDRTVAENRVLDETISEIQQYSDSLSKNISLQMDENQSVYRSESDLGAGMAHIGYRKGTGDSTQEAQVISEDYHGSFKVLVDLDSYGDSVKFNKSSRGRGFVSSDKRRGSLQRSFEHGSGYYYSQESSQDGSIIKDSQMLYAPMKLKAGSTNLSYAALWDEGMWTRDPERGQFIGEEIQSAPYINKVAGLERSSLSLRGNFNGTMNIRVDDGFVPGKENHLLDQTFVGNFSIQTAISVYDSPEYLYPHIAVSKKAIAADEDTILFRINVTNDGNQPLSSIEVSDRLPEGLAFLNSSLRPEINGQIIRWHIPSLAISRTLSIELRAKVVEEGYPFVNRVSVQAAYRDLILTANNSTLYNPDYLSCCPTAGRWINLTGISNVTSAQGSWGDWMPSPCFNATSEDKDCYCQMEQAYDALESRRCNSDCPSAYEIP